ncbi:DUF1622 domain-containing protein [Micromonospora sp. NPDC047793]|uniref:DUF1622 domain-containing protein n=1 Tax=unclassified Micromonospora TaxID=2617518 RepID=UPI0010345FF7|nr:DUF1622 domain-containing protein [Verrucosispora sp. SN26_14.1]TBL33217.1 DUF1622 domain-containing protein [Verrucosispora sp. SN26_14.1]
MIQALATVVAALGVLGAGVALVTTGSRSTALRILLDMLVAAGLLRLTGEQTWRELAATVVIVLLRRMLSSALTENFRWSAGPGGPAGRIGRASGR